MTTQARTSGGRFGRKIDGDEARQTVDTITESGETAAVPDLEPRTTITTEPAASLPADPLPSGEPGAVPLDLWVPVEIGGGDVVMLCQFSEAHIQLLQTRAEEQSMTLAELMPELFARMCDHAWV